MIPCGIVDKSVTSIFEETNKQMKLEHISKTFAKVFQNKIEM